MNITLLPLQVLASLWLGWQLHVLSASGVWSSVILQCLWSSGKPSSRCGPPSMTVRYVGSLLMPKTSLLAVLLLSARIPCWDTQQKDPGKQKESWSGLKAKSGALWYLMKYILSLVRKWCADLVCYTLFVLLCSCRSGGFAVVLMVNTVSEPMAQSLETSKLPYSTLLFFSPWCYRV